jgi:hypothetical protein
MAEINDYNLLDRQAQPLIAEFRTVSQYGYGAWQPIYSARVESVTLRQADRFNTAVISFPTLRWEQMVPGLVHGSNIRIRTDQPVRGNGQAYPGAARTVLFQGFVTNYKTSFSGRNSSSGAEEQNTILCADYRWLLSVTSPIFGIIARSRDDYDTFGDAQTSVAATNAATWFSGRRCIFNESGKPNRDSTLLSISGHPSYPGVSTTVPIFSAEVFGDPQPWTIRQMIQSILNPLNNKVWSLFPLLASSVVGIDHADLDRVVNGVVADTDDIVKNVISILRHIGFSLSENYTLTGPYWTVYKSSAAAGSDRSATQPNILHTLHAPAVGEKITTAVYEGRKMLWGGMFDEDIAAIINNPIGLGAPHRFEFTAELVPAWKDSDLTVPDPVYLTESEIQADDDPNANDFYKYFHAQGSGFLSEVGRKWALNEAGDYSSTVYDRGMPFDFSAILAAADAFDSDSRRRFGLFRRAFLAPLTFDAQNVNSVGIRVEFSFDGGTTWHIPQIAVRILQSECGIYIEDANLSELLDPAVRSISGGTLDGYELNYWTSLCNDKLNNSSGEESFKNGDWQTRVRVTASVQMDQRLWYESVPSYRSGSPFRQRTCYDFSDRYTYQRRTDSSVMASLSVWETDEYDTLAAHLDDIRDANQDISINGRFTLERLWLGDGSGLPDICIGDGVSGLTGRNYSLASSLNGSTVYPEIIEITYDIQRQKQHLITRDIRLSEMAG